jgi:hypothetical protein
VFVVAVALLGCAELAPLREPAEPPGTATTQAEMVRLFGSPDQVAPWEGGTVLTYRRVRGLSSNPNRLSRADPVEARILIYVDANGRIVRVERPPL